MSNSMKRTATIGVLLIALVFQNCKNNKPQPTDLENNTTETTVVQEDLDTSNAIPTDTLQTEEKVSEEIKENVIVSEEATKPIEKEVEKVTQKVENTTTNIKKEETEPVTDDTVEKVVETVVINEPVEDVVEKEVETITEPVVEKVPEREVSATNTWVVPSKYRTMKNPTDPKVDLSIGKNLYSKHCKSCHGAEGYGDGPKANEMNGDLGDFSSEEFQNQSDGALFYKTTIGRDDMPEFTKKLPDDEDRWLIVNYMRTLAE